MHGLDGSERGQHGTQHAIETLVRRTAVGATSAGALGGRSPSPANALGTYAQDVDEEEAHHEFEHDRLAHGVACQALRHLAVRRLVLSLDAQVKGLPLDRKEQALARVGQVGRRDNRAHHMPT